MSEIRIETERLILRRMRDEDLAEYLDCESQPGHTQYLSREPYTEAEAKNFIATSRDLPLDAEGTYLHLALEHKATGRVIGTSCIKVTSRAHGQGDMGWFLHAGCRGQGLATEASRAMLEFAFTTLDLHRITAHCDGENTPLAAHGRAPGDAPGGLLQGRPSSSTGSGTISTASPSSGSEWEAGAGHA